MQKSVLENVCLRLLNVIERITSCINFGDDNTT